ncbi:uncharacterized protein BDR25DRAFT_349131 [Lindgomyces ingoldianus]|uniref:Uncharacterized protein n=1 Tax=Lindgomyces ingoldianus TaxID=673940 RepID=A0ACB6REM4_9PLEO|nr:uncharacterized protein BDR25DRAFT_349131 [Lindgomyces ingoldianus]KAF2477203.1 hypothetical protein BDR25DRAFT_349131 [Lindgomyces ingoldianus]
MGENPPCRKSKGYFDFEQLKTCAHNEYCHNSSNYVLGIIGKFINFGALRTDNVLSISINLNVDSVLHIFLVVIWCYLTTNQLHLSSELRSYLRYHRFVTVYTTISALLETPTKDGAAGGIWMLGPVWSKKVGPYGMLGKKRLPGLSLEVQDLPELDAMCISHDHDNHLDSEMLRQVRIAGGERVRPFVPFEDQEGACRPGLGIRMEEVMKLGGIGGIGALDLECLLAYNGSWRTPGREGEWILLLGAWGMVITVVILGDTGYCRVTSDTEPPMLILSSLFVCFRWDSAPPYWLMTTFGFHQCTLRLQFNLNALIM